MAITRETINGSFSAMKAAFDTLIPNIFSSVEYDDNETPTMILCKDSNENLLFKIEYDYQYSGSNRGWRFTAYKSGGTSINVVTSGTTEDSYGAPSYLYKVGTEKAVIHFAYSASHAACIFIGKTNTGTVCFCMPTVLLSNSSANNENNSCVVASWDDDDNQTSALEITGQTPFNGNQSFFMPVPLHGTFAEAIKMQDIFCLPMAQSNLRAVFQELTDATSGEHYLTNGYIAVKDE